MFTEGCAEKERKIGLGTAFSPAIRQLVPEYARSVPCCDQFSAGAPLRPWRLNSTPQTALWALCPLILFDFLCFWLELLRTGLAYFLQRKKTTRFPKGYFRRECAAATASERFCRRRQQRNGIQRARRSVSVSCSAAGQRVCGACRGILGRLSTSVHPEAVRYAAGSAVFPEKEQHEPRSE